MDAHGCTVACPHFIPSAFLQRMACALPEPYQSFCSCNVSFHPLQIELVGALLGDAVDSQRAAEDAALFTVRPTPSSSGIITRLRLFLHN